MLDLEEPLGICNISLKNVPKQRRKYFSDIFTTVIEMKWRWCLLYFSLSFLISWTFFASLYYSIGKHHGDVDNRFNVSWTPCIVNVHSEINAFLFSFTTQTTIGYGFRYPTDQCPLTIITMCVQFMWGVMTQTLMAGIIFSKLARPIKRAATLIFSKNAVICMRDGKLCLLFRVGDMRKSSLAEAHVRLQMIKRCVTYEGELLPFHQFDMDVGYDQGLDRIFVIWPITICHEIDEMSPLYDVGEADLKNAKFEIIAILEGVVESVGSTTQARTSYLPSEILWGKSHDFSCKMVENDKGDTSSDEEMDTETSSMEAAALARKKRLLEMKSRLNGIEMKEEDYQEEEQATKKSKSDEKLFRSYQPISEAVGKVQQSRPKLDVVEELVASQLEDASNVKPVETVDLSTLAPKKIDWDLKRDIEKRLQKLERRTQKCIAEMIRQRLAEGKGDLASTVNAGV
ncbi:hypothetical protein Y032_0003g1256 [Ancylostoma ceylanicum]|nr:hypothetical protein Y032_0003g1256 [Ancylostoma ceylanicum]